MTPTPIEALIEALSSGLHRPLYLWTLAVIALAVAGGLLFSRIVRKHTEQRLLVMHRKAMAPRATHSPTVVAPP